MAISFEKLTAKHILVRRNGALLCALVRQTRTRRPGPCVYWRTELYGETLIAPTLDEAKRLVANAVERQTAAEENARQRRISEAFAAALRR